MPPRHPLVVVGEDNADMNRAMDSMLQAAGFETAMSFSAEALLKAGVPADTACLVLDVHLPGMTGFELYDSLAAIHPDRITRSMVSINLLPGNGLVRYATAPASFDCALAAGSS